MKKRAADKLLFSSCMLNTALAIGFCFLLFTKGSGSVRCLPVGEVAQSAGGADRKIKTLALCALARSYSVRKHG